MTDWPSRWVRFCARMRARISVLPPGVYGTTIVTVRVGYSCARAVSGHAAAAPPITVMKSRRRIAALPGFDVTVHSGSSVAHHRRPPSRWAGVRHRIAALIVGWVEQSETHHLNPNG